MLLGRQSRLPPKKTGCHFTDVANDKKINKCFCVINQISAHVYLYFTERLSLESRLASGSNGI